MNSEIPFFSLRKVPETIKNEWSSAVHEILRSGQFVGGSVVRDFEELWAKAVGVKHAIGVGNGLDGLVIALRALGISEDDLVAVPVHTFIATWNAVKLVGATPVGIDVDERGLMNLDALFDCDKNIKCVIPVHMHGAMVDIKSLMAWAHSRKVYVVEDASQAHLATFNGIKAGELGHIGVFSLYPTKNLGALGDAGIIVSNNDLWAQEIRTYANYGAVPSDKYFHKAFGVNSRLDTIHASILKINLSYLPEWNKRRTEIAQIYLSKIAENEYLRFLNKDPNSSVWHHFPILSRYRAELISHLNSSSIRTEIHYPRTAASEYFQITGVAVEDFPMAQNISENILSLPISPWHTDEEINYVCEAINSFKP